MDGCAGEFELALRNSLRERLLVMGLFLLRFDVERASDGRMTEVMGYLSSAGSS